MSIVFDDDVAVALVSAATDAASELRDQGIARYNAVDSASEGFSGGQSSLFHWVCNIESADRVALAGAMDELVTQIEAARVKAAEEKQRLAELAAWEARKEAATRSGTSVDPDDPMPSSFAASSPSVDVSFAARTRQRTGPGRGGGGRSSAIPLKLRSFAATTREADLRLSSVSNRLLTEWSNFQYFCSWVSIAAATFNSGFRNYLEENRLDALWADAIAAAFEKAGGGTIADPDLNAEVLFTMALYRGSAPSTPAVTGALRGVGRDFGQTAGEFNDWLSGMSNDEFEHSIGLLKLSNLEGYWYGLSIMSPENLARLHALEPALFEPGVDRLAHGDWLRQFLGILVDRGPVAWSTPPGDLGTPDGWKNIKQGDLSNCWFVAALAIQLRDDASGEWFENHVIKNPNGTITVLLRDIKTGKMAPVTVTDRLSNGDGSVHIEGLNLAAYIEKAAAEFYKYDSDGVPPGQYAALEWGNSADAFRMFDDHDIERMDASGNADLVWAHIRAGDSVTVSTFSESPPGVDKEDFEGDYWTGHVFISSGLDHEGRMVLQNPHNLSDRSKDVHLTPAQFEKYFNQVLVIK